MNIASGHLKLVVISRRKKKRKKKKETESRARTLTYRTRHEGRVKDFEKNKKVEYVNKNLTPIMVSKAFYFHVVYVDLTPLMIDQQ